MDRAVRVLLFSLFMILLILVLLYAAATLASLNMPIVPGNQGPPTASDLIRSNLTNAPFEVWRFFRPLIQFAIILLILHSFVRALGIDLRVYGPIENMSTQRILILLVVGGFVLGSFLSQNPADWTKDLALVVVGFYLGTRVKDSLDDEPHGSTRTFATQPGPTSHAEAGGIDETAGSRPPEETGSPTTSGDTGASESGRSNRRRYDRS
jgi:hypothetical protein